MTLKDFVDYCWSFYGPHQLYGEYFDHNMTKPELTAACKERMKDKKNWGDGDSFDREAVRDIMLKKRGKHATVIAKEIRRLEAALADGKTEHPEEKDYKRMEDIITKSKGDEEKMLQLCRQMAKSIKDHLKAVRRAEAAKEILPPSVGLKAYRIFMEAA
jgi:hypothetical protein